MTDKFDIKLTDMVEHEDGSATYSFDVDEGTSELLREKGLLFLLVCGVCELSVDEAIEKLLETKK